MLKVHAKVVVDVVVGVLNCVPWQTHTHLKKGN
jgi:hypothetical protein